MSTSSNASPPPNQKPRRSMAVRKAAAQVAITASKLTGRPVDERVKKIAEAQ